MWSLLHFKINAIKIFQLLSMNHFDKIKLKNIKNFLPALEIFTSLNVLVILWRYHLSMPNNLKQQPHPQIHIIPEFTLQNVMCGAAATATTCSRDLFRVHPVSVHNHHFNESPSPVRFHPPQHKECCSSHIWDSAPVQSSPSRVPSGAAATSYQPGWLSG